MGILSKLNSLLKEEKEAPEPLEITPELVDCISSIYAYRIAIRTGDYNDAPYHYNKNECRKVLRCLCHLGYKLISSN